MEYFVLDVGGSSIKYAVMDENQKFIRKGKAESRHLQNSDEFVSCLSELYREAGQLIMKVMKDGRRADGIITSSDRAAFGAMKALGKVGFYSPEDVRLISFDNSPYSTMASPSITSLDRNPASLAGRPVKSSWTWPREKKCRKKTSSAFHLWNVIPPAD